MFPGGLLKIFVAIFLVGSLATLTVLAFKSKSPSQQEQTTTTSEPIDTSSPSADKSTVKTDSDTKPTPISTDSSTNSPKTGTVKFHAAETIKSCTDSISCFNVSDEKELKLPDRLIFRLTNTDTSERLEKAGVTDWEFTNLKPGNYRIQIYFKDPYTIRFSDCQDCQEKSSFNESWSCGYQIKIHEGDNAKIVCKFANRS